MLARVASFAIEGVGSSLVWVEADVRRGLPAFTIVGLADRSVQESRERVRSAIVNSGFDFPQRKITVNLAPAHLKKNGAGFDLAVAIAILVASGQIQESNVNQCGVVGELSLSGQTCSITGALSIAEEARAQGFSELMLPRSRVREASFVTGIGLFGIDSLREAYEVLQRKNDCKSDQDYFKVEAYEQLTPSDRTDGPDFADVRGQNALIPALEIAAAGGHNLYLHGPPGTGKTMLASRITSILPKMTEQEAIEVTRIHSITGNHDEAGFIVDRPFRAPHHTISTAGLIGGGFLPTPGEITLAHNGVLFLDELPEFTRSTIEALRQPMEDGRVSVVRSQRAVIFPSRFMLVAAANPCPCGMGENDCQCSAAGLARYRRKISGPLLDRIDIVLYVCRPSAQALQAQSGPSSKSIRDRVQVARLRQQVRYTGTKLTCNAQVSDRPEGELIRATGKAVEVLYKLHEQSGLSGRANSRILRVARTIADLADSDSVYPEHILEAASYRWQSGFQGGQAA